MKRRFLVPEVIQTSAMDCGPASLKALCGGFDVYLSYGRLREACQTDIDGTCIDRLEEIACQLGMDASQSVIPADLILCRTSACLPAIAVMRLPDGSPHFVVVWRALGGMVQVMDPAAGRLWMERARFLSSLYIHEQVVPGSAWEEWSQSEAFEAGLTQRMRALGLSPTIWTDRAHQDAALRLAGALRAAGALRRRAEAASLFAACADHPEEIPAAYWMARTVGDDEVSVRGAVVLRIRGPSAEFRADQPPESLSAITTEPPPRVWAPVLQALREAGRVQPAAVAGALLVAASGTVIGALVFRSLFDLGRHLELSGQRLAAVAAVLIFLAALLALEWPAATGLLRLGRHLEIRLRTRFAIKVPRLADRYFQSRLISDMAFRAHGLQLLRQLPESVGELLRLVATLLLTAAAIVWLYPSAAIAAVLAILLTCGVPLLFLPAMVERDLRCRETSAALSRFSLDALLGARAVQAHGADRLLLAAHAQQLGHWADAGLRQQALLVRAELVQLGLGFALVIALVFAQAKHVSQPEGLLLLVYWAVSIPLVGERIGILVGTIPSVRNTLLRFLEPLGSPEQAAVHSGPSFAAGGVGIEIDGVSVTVAGHRVLDGIDLRVDPGECVGIVGVSGAGKSSLAGLLLGWYEPSAGMVRVDGERLDGACLARLRRDTAWIDPQVHLFRASLFDNLCYGNGEDAPGRIRASLGHAGLGRVLERLPDGLQTPLGDAGALVSGGEGQSVRIGRALTRSRVRLAVLDEPARGLDRERRRQVLSMARRQFPNATVLFITHDVTDTLDCNRVVVVEKGRIREEGSPRELSRRAGSRYRELLMEEQSVSRDLWSHPRWRRLRLCSGKLIDNGHDG